jgi:hypothetical protein
MRFPTAITQIFQPDGKLKNQSNDRFIPSDYKSEATLIQADSAFSGAPPKPWPPDALNDRSACLA